MTPYFFRGCMMVSFGIITLSEFFELRYKDFTRLEAVHQLRTNYAGVKAAKQKKAETASRLMGLPTVSLDDMDIPEEAKAFLRANDG